jgi:hypothetical protein
MTNRIKSLTCDAETITRQNVWSQKRAPRDKRLETGKEIARTGENAH